MRELKTNEMKMVSGGCEWDLRHTNLTEEEIAEICRESSSGSPFSVNAGSGLAEGGSVTGNYVTGRITRVNENEQVR